MNLLTPFSPAELGLYWPIIVEGVLVSVALGLIGCFLVVRGMSLLGDALSHSVLPGIVVGFLISWKFGHPSLHSPWILFGATIVGLLAAMLVETVEKQSRVKEDASLGIIFTTLFALGVVMINVFGEGVDLDAGCVLYGNIEYFTSRPHAILPMAYILCGVVLGIVLFYRQLIVSTFDPALAVSLGIPAVLIHYAMMAALSLTVVASFEAVGAILAVALLIMPGATARLWTNRMPTMLLLSAAHGVLSTIVGYWLSHAAVWDTSASGAICVAGFGLFLLSWLLAPQQGLVTQILARRSLNRTIGVENLIKAIDELSIASGEQWVAHQALSGELRLPPKLLEKTIRRAETHELIRVRSGAYALTPAGKARSQRISRAHLLWEQFLQQKVGIAPDHVHDAAEWIEHHLSDETVDQIDQALGGKPAG
jgi:ABC-type Mn2+/Zn2+ transport system permease subunit/Mn-dependent DtxR family transcriptional regulator